MHSLYLPSLDWGAYAELCAYLRYQGQDPFSVASNSFWVNIPPHRPADIEQHYPALAQALAGQRQQGKDGEAGALGCAGAVAECRYVDLAAVPHDQRAPLARWLEVHAPMHWALLHDTCLQQLRQRFAAARGERARLLLDEYSIDLDALVHDLPGVAVAINWASDYW